MAKEKQVLQKKKILPKDERISLIDDLIGQGWMNFHLIANWCGNLSLLSDELLKDETRMASLREGMFWIRLWSVVVDLHERFSKTVASGSANEFAKSVSGVIQSIRSKLSEDDLIVLDYLRQTNCHVTQSGYEKGLNVSKAGDESIKDEYTVKTIPKRMKLDDISKVLTARMKAFKADQSAIAKDFASRLNADLEKLWELTKAESDRQRRDGRPH